MNVQNGIAAEFYLAVETSFGGTVGQWLRVPGKTRMSWQPVLSEGVGSVFGVYRANTKEGFTKRHYQGSFEILYGSNLVLANVLGSFFATISSAADTPSAGYKTVVYGPRRLGGFGSLKVAVDWDTAGRFTQFNGLVIDRVTIEVRARQIVRMKFDWKCKSKEMAVISPATTALNPLFVGGDCAVTLGTTTPGRNSTNEFTLIFDDPKTPCRFDEDKTPQRFSGRDKWSVSGEMVELLQNFEINDLVDGVLETSVELAIQNVSEVASLDFQLPRAVFTTGTPDGFSSGELPVRAAFKGLIDDALGANEPLLTMIVPTDIVAIPTPEITFDDTDHTFDDDTVTF